MPQTNYLLVVIVENVERLPDLLQAWRESGVPGATILHSTGMHRITSWMDRMGLGALEHVVEAGLSGQRTLLVAIQGEELLGRAIAAAERILGDFDRQHGGLLLALPVARVHGLRKVRSREPAAAPPPQPPPKHTGWVAQRNMPIEEVLPHVNLEPTIVPLDMDLMQVGRIMMERSSVHVACVVNEEGRLEGLINLRSLADDLFFRIVPEEFLSEVTDLDQMRHYAKLSGLHTAEDAMQEPVWIEKHEPVKTAFQRMHDHRLPGLPVVDENFRPVGYLNLLALLFGSVKVEDKQEGAGGS